MPNAQPLSCAVFYKEEIFYTQAETERVIKRGKKKLITKSYTTITPNTKGITQWTGKRLI